MKLHIIFGQRHCRWAGEYAPEALDIADENTMESHPQWLSTRLSEHREDVSFSAVEVLCVNVPDEAVVKALNPTPPVVEATVCQPEA
jgi:hypothetical protein